MSHSMRRGGLTKHFCFLRGNCSPDIRGAEVENLAFAENEAMILKIKTVVPLTETEA
jgi:hypothetical protein